MNPRVLTRSHVAHPRLLAGVIRSGEMTASFTSHGSGNLIDEQDSVRGKAA
ncbi:hypothetical protein [Deinococcus apachensis]|uniref:hypothetical protein n=1 Tax=Deinococcus apachensis TaxID=309886 RepID=UPI00036BDDEA|nr:hypothetical protein [Deinococcus apachensis]